MESDVLRMRVNKDVQKNDHQLFVNNGLKVKERRACQPGCGLVCCSTRGEGEQCGEKVKTVKEAEPKDRASIKCFIGYMLSVLFTVISTDSFPKKHEIFETIC